MIQERIEKHHSHFFIVHEGDTSYLLLFLPYSPYKEVPPGYAAINAFYPTSNKLYFTSKALEEELADFGATLFKGNLKKLFVEAECAIYLRNRLVAIPPYGTRVALAALVCHRLPTDEIKLSSVTTDTFCESCKLCVANCPTHALDDGFKKELCLRYACDTIETTDLDLSLMNKSILGCDECQCICPYNAEISPVGIPSDLLNLLKIESLIQSAQGGRKGLFDLCEYIGNNYNRPARILKLVKIAEEVDKKS